MTDREQFSFDLLFFFVNTTQNNFKKIKECGLGVQSRLIVSDSHLTAGSHWNNREEWSAKNGRLFNTAGAKAWCGGYDSNRRTSGTTKSILFNFKIIFKIKF